MNTDSDTAARFEAEIENAITAKIASACNFTMEEEYVTCNQCNQSLLFMNFTRQQLQEQIIRHHALHLVVR